MQLDDMAIRTDTYKPKMLNGNETGLLEYVGQRSYGDLKAQFEAVLSAISIKEWGCTALEAAEYISYGEYKQDESQELPKGQEIVLARRGKCEGYRVEIAIIDENSHCHTIISVKYLSNLDAVWVIAKQIDNALWQGGFGCE